MLTLVIGGAASGKSEWAEELVRHCQGPRYYVATMQPFGDEALARIEKHRRRREADGYTTFECYTGLANLTFPEPGTVLLDCLGNLLANEMFAPEGAGTGDAGDAILDGVERVRSRSKGLILVTNEVFSGRSHYAGDTDLYMRELGRINCCIANAADAVCEVCCGLPHYVKGKEYDIF